MIDFNTLGDIARTVLASGNCPNHLKKYERIYADTKKNMYVSVVDKKKTVAHMQITMQRGVEAGIQPITALNTIVWYNGRPCLYGDAAWASVASHPEYSGFEESEDGFVLNRTKAHGKVVKCVRNFTREEAEKAGLMSLPHWQKYTERMLMIRSRGWAMRDLFADVLNGLSLAEEQKDIEQMGNHIVAPIEDAPIDEFTQKALEERGLSPDPQFMTASEVQERVNNYGTAPMSGALDKLSEAHEKAFEDMLTHGVSTLKTEPGAINYVDMKEVLKMPGFTIECENCGEAFQSKNDRRKFCSQACKSQFHYNKKREEDDE